MRTIPLHANLIACTINNVSLETPNRSHAKEAFIFNHFLSSESIELEGKPCRVYPGDCLLQTGNQLQEYHSGTKNFDAEWCSFEGSGIQLMINGLGLPTDQIFRPASTHFVSPLLEKITLESDQAAKHWQMVVSSGLQELLIKLSRHWMKSQVQGIGNGSMDPQEKLGEARTIVHDQLEKQWTIPDMARLCNLSASRFAFLYKKNFEVSPMEDLIRKRIRQAMLLLSDTSKSISTVAEESGFEDLQYFYRAFKKRVGTTPRRIRTRNSSPSPWRSYDEERGNLEAVWAASDFHGMIGLDEKMIPHVQAVSGDWSKLGWERKELTGIPFYDFFHPAEKHLIEKAYQTISDGGILRDLQLSTLCKNGSYRKVDWTGAETGGCFYFSAKVGKPCLTP